MMPQAPSSLLVRADFTIVIDLITAHLPVVVGGLSHRVLVYQRGGERAPPGQRRPRNTHPSHYLPQRVGGTLDEVQFRRGSN
jgi:hypothetical protein